MGITALKNYPKWYSNGSILSEPYTAGTHTLAALSSALSSGTKDGIPLCASELLPLMTRGAVCSYIGSRNGKGEDEKQAGAGAHAGSYPPFFSLLTIFLAMSPWISRGKQEALSEVHF